MQVGPRAWGGSGDGEARAIPPELISIRDLGPVRQVFNGAKNVFVAAIVLGSIGLVLVVVGILIAVLANPWAAIMIPLPALILLIIAAINLSTLLGVARVVVTYQDGFAALAGSRVVHWRWEDVAAILSNERMVAGKRSVSHIKSYVLTSRSGEQLRIEGDRLEDVRAAMKSLKDHIEPKILAVARNAYDAGYPVVFGPVIVSKEAVVISGRSIVWSQVANVKVKDGQFVVTREGGATSKVSVKKIPNVEALGALIGIQPNSMDLESY